MMKQQENYLYVFYFHLIRTQRIAYENTMST